MTQRGEGKLNFPSKIRLYLLGEGVRLFKEFTGISALKNSSPILISFGEGIKILISKASQTNSNYFDLK